VTEILELQVLHSIAEHESWQRAAHALRLDPVKLRQTLDGLERRLGIRLVQDSALGVTLTAEGLAFHARTQRVLEGLAEVEAQVSKRSWLPTGKVRITAPVVLGTSYVAPLLKDLRERYRDLSVELSLNDRFVDLVHENVDVAIRAGMPFDARLTVRRLCVNRRVLVASPAYLAKHGTPQQPSDLSQHECVLFTSFTNPQEWRLSGPEGVVAIKVRGQMSTNNGYVLNTLAEQGEGISFGATLSLAPALIDGRLVRVLPEFEMEETAIFAAYPAVEHPPLKVRAVVDFFAEHFSDPPSWDQKLDARVAGF
jgi:DNA-binding transcriptional LysR family regulator